jgi:hypothetical protein
MEDLSAAYDEMEKKIEPDPKKRGKLSPFIRRFLWGVGVIIFLLGAVVDLKEIFFNNSATTTSQSASASAPCSIAVVGQNSGTIAPQCNGRPFSSYVWKNPNPSFATDTMRGGFATDLTFIANGTTGSPPACLYIQSDATVTEINDETGIYLNNTDIYSTSTGSYFRCGVNASPIVGFFINFRQIPHTLTASLVPSTTTSPN